MAILKLIRYKNLIIILVTMLAVRYFLLYPLLHLANVPLLWEWYNFMALVLSTILIAAGGYIINNNADLEIDRVNVPGEVVVGDSISDDTSLNLYYLFTGSGLALGAWCAISVDMLNLAFIQVLVAGALYFYSTTFKYQVFIGNLVVAAATGLVPLIAGVYDLVYVNTHYGAFIHNVDQELTTRVLKTATNYLMTYSLLAFLINFAREIVKDAEDVEGDMEHEVGTLAVRFGTKASVLAGILVLMICLGILSVIINELYENENYKMFTYIVALIISPLILASIKLFLASGKKDFTYISRLLKFIMLAGIGFLPFLAYIMM